ncbi:hypothetical protein [Sphingomonas sp. CFBP9019]|uniref:hypothetical protein n=1 Tax=Sphingomonas sp. CFBP9019 TaxID=3096532 RepID=UPI000A94E346|nr:hypothetical protein [Sphingomonas sp. CFBP9019]MDY1007031.1 hypothetical protein [Sphingomonas sp. CFBP9019]
MFKTMWKMPAKLLRRAVAESSVDGENAAPVADEQIASGSLEDMIKAADELAAEDADALTIECVGRDRPITWAEIQGLRHATTFPVGV